MPPHAPLWAPDAGLAIVYRWLGGVDAVGSPPTVTVNLKSLPEAETGGQAAGRTEIAMTALSAESARNSRVRDLASLVYRVTLVTNSSLSVSNRALEYQPVGVEGWSKVTLSEEGEIEFDQSRRFILANARTPEKMQTRLRLATTAARAVVVVEAVDYTQPEKPVIAGMGSVVLEAPAGRSVYGRSALEGM